MKNTIIAVVAFVLCLTILLCLIWFSPLLASVALIAKVIFTVLATGFVVLMAYEMIKTELERLAYKNNNIKYLSLKY